MWDCYVSGSNLCNPLISSLRMLEINSHYFWGKRLRSKIANYGRLIRFSHTIFALPFALAAVALAWPSHPLTLRSFFWILVAMVGARSAAMAFNRLVDRKFDALNPRTYQWELPQGTVKVWEAAILTLTSSVVFVYAAYQLNFVCFVLSPVALTIVFFYSLTKRFTWASHLFLGLALSLAPMGAWLAVSGSPIDLSELATPFFLGLAVLFWLAGFDVIYSLQDLPFDRQHGTSLHSRPFWRCGRLATLELFSFLHNHFSRLGGARRPNGSDLLGWVHRGFGDSVLRTQNRDPNRSFAHQSRVLRLQCLRQHRLFPYHRRGSQLATVKTTPVGTIRNTYSHW